MNSVNKTLYIPLYGKAFVSKRGLFLKDKKAEEIWEKEKFPLGRKSSSKWLAYFMGMRSSVIDGWVSEKLSEKPESVVLHIGCGLDSRIERVNAPFEKWFDIDGKHTTTYNLGKDPDSEIWKEKIEEKPKTRKRKKSNN